MKSPLKSRTVLMNMLVLAVGLVGYAAGADVMEAYPQTVAILVAVGGALNIALRFLTTEPIG